jgi:hypothetical protein
MLEGFLMVMRWIFTPFIALFLLFEEWGWVPLAALLSRLKNIPFWAWCERRIAKLPPWAALILLLAPSIGLLPAKFMALWLIRHGQYGLGIFVLLSAKLVGTALLARLFELIQPALMQFGWFAKWYPRWKAWKDKLLASIRSSRVWQLGRSIKLQVKSLISPHWYKVKAWFKAW